MSNLPGVRRVGPEEGDRIYAMRQSGMPFAKIAAATGRAECTLRSYLHRQKHRPVLPSSKPGRARFWTPERLQELANMRAGGVPRARLAAHFGVTLTAITSTLRVRGTRRSDQAPGATRVLPDQADLPESIDKAIAAMIALLMPGFQQVAERDDKGWHYRRGVTAPVLHAARDAGLVITSQVKRSGRWVLMARTP